MFDRHEFLNCPGLPLIAHSDAKNEHGGGTWFGKPKFQNFSKNLMILHLLEKLNSLLNKIVPL